MRRAAVLGLALVGCDQAFGVDHVDSRNLVQGQLAFRIVHNDTNGRPMIDTALPTRPVSVAVVLDDGSKPEVDYASGAFTFERTTPTQRYRIQVTIEGQVVETVHDVAEITVGVFGGGHLERRPVIASTISFPYPPMASATSAAWVTSSGIYTQTLTNQYGPNINFDWRLASPLGFSGMLDASQGDRVYAYQLGKGSLANGTFDRISTRTSASITQPAGGSVTLPALDTADLNTCMHIASSPPDMHAKLTAATNRTDITKLAADWFAFMIPSPDAATIGGLWVAHQIVSATDAYDVTPDFHDPYPGTTLVANVGVSQVFSIQLPGTTAGVLLNSLRVNAIAERAIPGACSLTPQIVSSVVGIGGNLQLAGTPLDADGKLVTLDLTHPIDVTFDAGDGRTDIYQPTLYELVADSGTTSGVLRWNSIIYKGRWTAIDPGVLEPGHRYIMGLSSIVGRADPASGDTVTMSWPLETAQTYSRWFEVAAL